MRYGLIPILCAALAACSPTVAPEETAQTAEQSALDAVAVQFPGVDVEGLANCVRDNATPDEIAVMATGGDPASNTALAILKRPATQKCVVDNDVMMPGAPA